MPKSINIQLTEVELDKVHISTNNNGDLNWLNAEFILKTANGIPAGEYELKELKPNIEDDPELNRILNEFRSALEDYVLNPINQDLKLIEAPNGEDDENIQD